MPMNQQIMDSTRQQSNKAIRQKIDIVKQQWTGGHDDKATNSGNDKT